MDYLFSIFGEKEQQAQLISIGVSAFVALIVVFVNQWFLSRRARKEVYIKKIEELYLAIEEYEDKALQFLLFLKQQKQIVDKDTIKEYVNLVSTSLQKVDMYMQLHFDSVEFSLEKYDQLHQEFYEHLYKNDIPPYSSLGDGLDVGDGLDDLKKHLKLEANYYLAIRKNAIEIKAIAKELMLKYKH